MTRIRHFNLPDVGEGLTEAEIVGWRVKVGDTVKVNDIVVEIETAKSLVELPIPYAGPGRVNDVVVEVGAARSLVERPIPYAGTVSALMAEPGTTVDVGSAIIAIATGSSAAVPAVETPPEEGAVEPGLIGGPAPGGRTSVLVGYGPRTTEAKRRPRKGSAVPAAPAAAAAQQSVQSAFSTAED